MWRKNQEASSSIPAEPANGPAVSAPGTHPASAWRAIAHPAPPDERSGRARTQIGKSIQLTAGTSGSGDVRIYGEFEGAVDPGGNALMARRSGEAHR